MNQKIQKAAIDPALAGLGRFFDLPPQGSAIMDFSGADMDVTSGFLTRGYEVARLQSAGGEEGVALLDTPCDATGLDAGSVDMALIAGADADACGRDVLFEAARILKPGAALVLATVGYVSLPGTVSFLTDSLFLQFNPFWQLPAPTRVDTALTKLAMSGFLGGQTHTHDTALSFSREDWVRFSVEQPAIVDANLSPAEEKDFRLVLSDYIKRDFGPARFFVPFRSFTYVGFKPN